MLFNSLEFALFLPIVFALYWFLPFKRLRGQNALVVVASYVFYGWWDWRFLGLILLSTLTDYAMGLWMGATAEQRKRKRLLWVSLGLNLGLLGFFKYFNFFVDSFTTAFTFFGVAIQPNTLKIILPVGISFYTFQTLSYTIDVYKRSIEPTRDLVAFAAFVSFFPQLVAGPIERASNLLPQFTQRRFFDREKAVDGLRQILWGLFKKVVIADSCAKYANLIFDSSATLSGSTLVLGALFFTFQIYGDFSGYSDIAIGTSRLFGISLKRNFAFPYFSRDIAEFWRRWHISLTSWFRDYLYIPLGGSRGSLWMKIRNSLIVFCVSGLWHGANWTFVAWGLLNALYFIPLLVTGRNKQHLGTVAEGRSLPSLKDFLSMLLTFTLTVLAWVFFRATSIEHAFDYLSGIFSPSLFAYPAYSGMEESLITIVLCVLFMLVEWQGRTCHYAIEKLGLTWKRPYRWAFYYVLVLTIVLLGGEQQQFIYFQF
ncbi:MAG: MBOAT family protein [Bacteroidales bacterium]|nr:MBOAT family protein [Bacteroidales bacterium]